MTIAFIPELIDYLTAYGFPTLIVRLALISVFWIAVFFAITIDFHYGTKKAKQLGEYVSSEGYRRTVSKFKDYYSSLTYAFLGDVIISPVTQLLSGIMPFLSLLPYFTIFVAAGLILTEFKSVREKASDKLRRRTDASFKQLAGILKDRELMNRILDEVSKNNPNTPS